MKLMGRVWTRAALVATFALSMSTHSFADEIEVNFPIYVEKFKVEAKERGLDLYDVDGFVESKGQRFVVYTYKPVTLEQLETIKTATWKSMRQ